jgi:hypothetical protein
MYSMQLQERLPSEFNDKYTGVHPMPDTEDHWSIKDFLGGIIGGAALSAVGVMMVINPTGGDDMATQGRRGLIKLLMKYIWSTPGGIIVALIGLGIVALTVHAMMTQYKEKNEE